MHLLHEDVREKKRIKLALAASSEKKYQNRANEKQGRKLWGDAGRPEGMWEDTNHKTTSGRVTPVA